MANFDAQPVTGVTDGFSFTSQTRIAAPFTEANMTWVEVENSTASDWAGFYVLIRSGTGNSALPGIFFVATGAAASEVRIATVPTTTAYRIAVSMHYVPVPVASGTRLSVSCSTNIAYTMSGQVIGILSADFDAEPTYTRYESGPYVLANDATYATWTKVDPGVAVDTKSAYIEISQTGYTNNVLNGDSLANTYDYFGVMINGNFNAANSITAGKADMATGAAASEVIYAPDIEADIWASEQTSYSMPLMTKVSAATSGTRISCRIAKSAIGNDPDRIRGVLLFGVR